MVMEREMVMEERVMEERGSDGGGEVVMEEKREMVMDERNG